MSVKSKSKSAPKKAYHHGDLKKALIAESLVQISAHGVQALSLREVARASGVSHTSAYRHFPNKESVLATIAEQGFHTLTDMMRAAGGATPDDPVEGLVATGIAYVEFAVAFPEHLQVMFNRSIVSKLEYPTLLQASLDAFDVLESLVRSGQGLGLIRGSDARVVALAAGAQVHGLAMLIASGELGPAPSVNLDHRALAAAIIGLQRDGLATPRGRHEV
jgi:AcrR family transcriptional regulator